MMCINFKINKGDNIAVPNFLLSGVNKKYASRKWNLEKINNSVVNYNKVVSVVYEEYEGYVYDFEIPSIFC